MRYYLIAGEASGDTYGALLIEALRSNDQAAEFRYWGGAEMRKMDSNQAMDYRETAFMGFYEVLKNLGKIRKLFAFCKKDILAFKPDRIIFIDYPGFNLRIAKWAHDLKFHCSYFVAPQLWAWKKNRYKKIQSTIDQLFVILPFEKEFYKDLGIQSEYHGHPLESIIQRRDQKKTLPDKLSIAVLPGSRLQELQKHLPVIEQVIKLRKEDDFKIALAPGIEMKDLESLIDTNLHNLAFIEGKTKEILKEADLALTKSGTSTLETALIGTPQIVFYKTSNISYSIGKKIVKLDFISLVNIIAQKEIVTELIQHDFNVSKINEEIENLKTPGKLKGMIQDYDGLRNQLKGEDIFKKIAVKIHSGVSDVKIS